MTDVYKVDENSKTSMSLQIAKIIADNYDSKDIKVYISTCIYYALLSELILVENMGTNENDFLKMCSPPAPNLTKVGTISNSDIIVDYHKYPYDEIEILKLNNEDE